MDHAPNPYMAFMAEETRSAHGKRTELQTPRTEKHRSTEWHRIYKTQAERRSPGERAAQNFVG